MHVSLSGCLYIPLIFSNISQVILLLFFVKILFCNFKFQRRHLHKKTYCKKNKQNFVFKILKLDKKKKSLQNRLPKFSEISVQVNKQIITKNVFFKY